MEKILISACLLGDKCRYDGKDNYFPFVEELQKHYELVAFCPEMAANLGCPRDPAEIKNDRVVTEKGKDLTEAYNSAAEQAVRLCDFLGIRIAILKDKSPACGCRHIHNGMFMGNTIEGLGVTARALISAGVRVYAETDALDFLIPNKEEKKESTGRYKHYEKKGDKPFEKKERSFRKDSYAKKERSYRKDEASSNKEGEHQSYKKKAYGDRPSYRKDGERKPYGERPSYKKDGERRSSDYKGERKSYGDKPAYKKSYKENSSYHKDGERKTYSKKGGSNAYHKERSFSRNKAARSSSSYSRKPSSSRRPSYNKKKAEE